MKRFAARFRPSQSGRVVIVGFFGTEVTVTLDRDVRTGETVGARDLVRRPAGAAFNSAFAAARAGARVSVVGRVGDDAAGRACVAALARHEVLAEGLLATPGAVTGGVLARTVAGSPPASTGSLVIVPGANALLSADDVAGCLADLGSADVVVLPWEAPVEAVAEALERARAVNARVMVGPGPEPAMRGAGVRPPEPSAAALRAADPLVLSGPEAVELVTGATGHREPVDLDAAAGVDDPRATERLVRGLLAEGPASVALILGDQGAVWADRNGTVRMPSVGVPVADRAGMSEAFAGTIAAGLAMGHRPRQVLARAAAAAAAASSHPGSQPWTM